MLKISKNWASVYAYYKLFQRHDYRASTLIMVLHDVHNCQQDYYVENYNGDK